MYIFMIGESLYKKFITFIPAPVYFLFEPQ